MTVPRRVWPWLVTYAVTLSGANVLTSTVGSVPAGFGLTVTAGTYTVGLALALRDAVHDRGGVRVVLVALVGATLCSALTADPQVAIASATAMVAAELTDLTVYAPLRPHSWAAAIVASGVVGSIVDSVGFL
jgi:queuosine precursor transporter